MIRPDEFYRKDEQLSSSQEGKIWKSVKREFGRWEGFGARAADARSFVLGMAAMLALLFLGLGGYGITTRSLEQSKPIVLRIDDAYRNAIATFEEVLPAYAATFSSSKADSLGILSRTEQLKRVDEAIGELRGSVALHDLSPMKREKLRELYSLKLKILQEMIEKGEVEL